MKSILRTVVCIAPLCLPLGAFCNPLVPLDDTLDQIVEEAVEDSVNQQVEDAVSDVAEETIAETVEETVGDTVDQSVADSISDSVESTVTQTVEESVGNVVSSSLEQSLEKTVEQVVEGTIAEGVADAVSEGVENTVGGLQDLLREGGGVLPPSLPERLPVKSQSGATVFYDVAVENGWRAVQGEWLLVLDKDELATLESLEIEVLERVALQQLGMVLVRFRVSNALDTYPALQEHFPKAMGERLERNHIYNYRTQSGTSVEHESRSQRAPVCKEQLKVGVIDTAVNVEHRAFSAVDISQRNFLQPGIVSVSAHGTAVAGILVGKGMASLPNASLAVASVIYQRDDGSQGSTILSLLKAFDWLSSEAVAVINMSIVGPPNALLERAINALSARGVAVVAAVGNEGPAAPPLYPAAYAKVIGATAVDSDNRIYRWANRGDHVDFAARGVAVPTAGDKDGIILETGTSMAAPVVTAYVACLQGDMRDGWGREKILARLGDVSIDLGAPGKDQVFGLGLLK